MEIKAWVFWFCFSFLSFFGFFVVFCCCCFLHTSSMFQEMKTDLYRHEQMQDLNLYSEWGKIVQSIQCYTYVSGIYSGRLLESEFLSPRPGGNCKSVPHLINQRCTTLSFSSSRYISCQIQSHSELPRLMLPSVAPSWQDSVRLYDDNWDTRLFFQINFHGKIDICQQLTLLGLKQF